MKKTKVKKIKKPSPKQLQEEYMSLAATELVNGWIQDQSRIPRDSRLLAYTKAVRQESTNYNILLKLQGERLADSVFDSLSSINKSIASGKIEDLRLKTRVDVNQDALERTDIQVQKVTNSLYNTGLKTAKNSESIMALVSHAKNISQEVKTLQTYLIIVGCIAVVGFILALF